MHPALKRVLEERAAAARAVHEITGGVARREQPLDALARALEEERRRRRATAEALARHARRPPK